MEAAISGEYYDLYSSLRRFRSADQKKLQVLPSVLCIVPLAFMPESPRWLVYQDRHEEAKAMIIKYHGGGNANSPIVAREYEEIRQSLSHEKATQTVGFKALVATKPNRWRLGVVAATAGKYITPRISFRAYSSSVEVFCQFSGNNIITYYLGETLSTAGITKVQTQLGINIGISSFSLVASVLGSIYTARLGRRPSFCERTLPSHYESEIC